MQGYVAEHKVSLAALFRARIGSQQALHGLSGLVVVAVLIVEASDLEHGLIGTFVRRVYIDVGSVGITGFVGSANLLKVAGRLKPGSLGCWMIGVAHLGKVFGGLLMVALVIRRPAESICDGCVGRAAFGGIGEGALGTVPIAHL